MLDQLNMYGFDKVEVALRRMKAITPRNGYFYLAFSGGKDSVVIKKLADMAGIPYKAYYNITSVDPPELLKFIKKCYPDVIRQYKKDKEGKPITMWSLIANATMPPTRRVRYCCEYLKEWGGDGMDKITGVRWAESVRRRKTWGGVNIKGKKIQDIVMLDPDNMNEDMVKYCMQSKGFILNPIIDWEDDDVWEFIRKYEVPYCKLYDEGHKRLGCIGCPMTTHKKEELEEYPTIKKRYLQAFDKMLHNAKKEYNWKTAEDVMEWWVNGY